MSVIICTYNRSASLKEALHSMAALESVWDLDCEILVVDNNSQDQTVSVVEDLKPQFRGRLFYVRENSQGLSQARNRGVREAKKEILAFIDDDCLADRSWLINIVQTFKPYDPDCVFGRIVPRWEGGRVPSWLSGNRELLEKLAILDYGDKMFAVSRDDRPFFGADFAMRKDTILEMGMFDINLGRRGHKLFSGEETDLFHRMVGEKKKIIYNPEICVEHRIGQDRMTKRYFRKWYFYAGCTHAGKGFCPSPSLLGATFWMIRECLITSAKNYRHPFPGRQGYLFRNQLMRLHHFGVWWATVIKKIKGGRL